MDIDYMDFLKFSIAGELLVTTMCNRYQTMNYDLFVIR